MLSQSDFTFIEEAKKYLCLSRDFGQKKAVGTYFMTSELTIREFLIASNT